MSSPVSSHVDAPWLSDTQQRVWRSFLRVRGGLDDELDRELQREAGLPHAYYLILAMLSEAPDRALRMSQLAAAAWASPSRISHAIDRLEAQGWVTRRPDERDRRGQIAVLTDLGWERLQSAAPKHARTVRRLLFDRLSPELLTAFEEICRLALEEMYGPGAADACAGGDVSLARDAFPARDASAGGDACAGSGNGKPEPMRAARSAEPCRSS